MPLPFPPELRERASLLLREAAQANKRKIVVLDDDPTGVQTVHGVSVYTDWSMDSLRGGFLEPSPLFFVLTNSRAMTEAQTARAHREIVRGVTAAARELHRDFLLVSRGDSTLRGHYPLETEVLREGLEAYWGRPVDGEILCPYFREGGRFTVGNVHYVLNGGTLVPAAETEFARDQTFGYAHSDLREYIQEKTRGAYRAGDVQSVTLAELRALDIGAVTAKLRALHGFQKLIVNAADDADLQVFCAALYRALDEGKRFCYRTAASFVKILAGIADRPLLRYREMVTADARGGGIVVVGSHTHKTTEQLGQLLTLPRTEGVELNSDLVLREGALAAEARRIAARCDTLMKEGVTSVVFTKRAVLSLPGDTPEAALSRSVRISEAVQGVVAF